MLQTWNESTPKQKIMLTMTALLMATVVAQIILPLGIREYLYEVILEDMPPQVEPTWSQRVFAPWFIQVVCSLGFIALLTNPWISLKEKRLKAREHASEIVWNVNFGFRIEYLRLINRWIEISHGERRADDWGEEVSYIRSRLQELSVLVPNFDKDYHNKVMEAISETLGEESPSLPTLPPTVH